MDHHKFLIEVKQRADLSDEAAAEAAARATLEVLGRRLYGGEAGDLAAQLPEGIKDYLMPSEANEAFGRDRFVQLVAEREHVNAPTAEKHIRAVLSVVSEAVSAGEMNHVWAQLPSDYASLF